MFTMAPMCEEQQCLHPRQHRQSADDILDDKTPSTAHDDITQRSNSTARSRRVKWQTRPDAKSCQALSSLGHDIRGSKYLVMLSCYIHTIWRETVAIIRQ